MSTSSPVTTDISRLPDTGEPPADPSSQLGKNEFLKLLTAQLANQDPLSPMDSQAFVAQLAQFSSVEQLQGLGSRLDTLLLAQASANQLNTASLVGKEIRFRSDSVTVTEPGAKTSFELSLEAKADETSIVISDSTGKVVRTLKPGKLGAGTTALEWDGLDSHGNPVPAGDYTVTVHANLSDAARTEVGSSLSIRGVVAAVTFENQAPELIVNGRHVKMSDVIQIAAPTPGS
jgi:flagellar basal-body rod modification protein FlgD